jgi:hypothetical protein
MRDIENSFHSNSVIPCRYELSWSESEKSIFMYIHKDIKELLPEFPEKRKLEKIYHDSSYSDLVYAWRSDGIGFGEKIQLNGDFCKLRINLTRFISDKQTCAYCEGTGKDRIDKHRKCFYCDGKKKSRRLKRDSIAEVLDTLNMLFTHMRYLIPAETKASQSQLMLIETRTDRGSMHGYAMMGEFSTTIVSYFRSQIASLPTTNHQVTFPEIEKAVKSTYDLLTDRNWDPGNFRAWLREDGALIANCPGNATGIGPIHYFDKDDPVYQFCSHNMDTSLQQISILAGLAALHDELRLQKI